MPILSPFISIIGDCDSGNCDPGSCSNASPRSTFDLQVLEGISLASVTPTTKPEYPRAISQIRAKEALAIQLVQREIKSRLRKTYTFQDVIETEITGKFNRDDFIVSNDLIGVEIKNVSCDPYVKVKLGWIEIKTKAAFSKDFIIVQGCTTETRCIDLVCGINRIELNLEDNDRIAVFAQMCGEEISTLSQCGYYDDYSCVKDNYCNCDCLTIRGVTDTDPEGMPAIDPLEEFESATLYFRVCASCRADVDELFCKHYEEMELAILYRLGILLMLEILNSDSIAPVVRNSKESADKLLLQWYGGTVVTPLSETERKGSYWDLVDQAVTYFETLLSNTNSRIIKCTGSRIAYSLPA